MTHNKTPEQMNFLDPSYSPTAEAILQNKEGVTDFFGNNRGFYTMLRKSGITYSGVNLDTSLDEIAAIHETNGLGDVSMTDIFEGGGPLDPKKITKETAVSIAKFFEENKDAREAFLKDSKD